MSTKMESNAGEENSRAAIPKKISKEEIEKMEYEAALQRFKEWINQHPFDIRTAFSKVDVPQIKRY